MSRNTYPQPAKQAAAKAFCAFNLAGFTVGAKAANVINVAVQLKDARGQNLSGIGVCVCYLSDNADGSTLTATVTTSAITVGTNGVILATLTTTKAVLVASKSDGSFDLNIPQTAVVTYYLVVCLPDGSIAVSPAIAFA